MNQSRRAWLRSLTRTAAGGAVLVVVAAPVAGQGIDCGRLRAQIADLGRGDAGKAAPYLRAAERQRSEINRTLAYSRSIGCDRQQFLFFGSAPPPQCPQINAQISRMEANLQALERTATQAGGGNEEARRDLTLRYNAYCGDGTRMANVAPPRQRGLFDFLFGGDSRQEPQQYERLPLEPPRPAPAEPETSEARGGNKAVCVRTCDGGFFPVSYAAGSQNLDTLGDMCRALCPNVEVALYTYSVSRDIDTAISADGEAYSDLPAAFKYQTSYDPACTCRPPGKTWVETLAEAERMLRTVKTDVIVTPEKAEELSRPKLSASTKPKPSVATAEAKAADPKTAPTSQADDASASEGAAATEVPTASKESAGINVGNASSGSVYGAGQGETREVIGPNGVKRRVRIVAPTL
ncbi:MAG: DUF2865 domain-containing protein [Methylobacteriaceae bacterium]|nr:DUF2865 domain-containing protein [Methylobacteriaceae bacterium]MBV9246196.1 DUF2865 domain-containing protein [Methylobacteriaceae bacterium]MBV9635653.1 DUF2865 domain-containing protein [Methylobacteriaceae bacterium]MBV9703067.1 DUF2865 domain-containing protein [Methylobacteriaceae bacterium]